VLRDLDHRVAEAAEAWLADPRDAAVYARLVAAVVERRAVLDAEGRVAGGPEPVAEGQVPDGEVPDGGDAPSGQDDQDDQDEDGEPLVPLLPLGADLVGDPRTVLDRLRRG